MAQVEAVRKRQHSSLRGSDGIELIVGTGSPRKSQRRRMPLRPGSSCLIAVKTSELLVHSVAAELGPQEVFIPLCHSF